MSSSNLFLGVPIALLILYLVLNSGFHSAASLSHLSLGEVAILSASFHLIFFFVNLVPASNLCAFHLFHGFFSASLYVINPVTAFIISASHVIEVCFFNFLVGPNSCFSIFLYLLFV